MTIKASKLVSLGFDPATWIVRPNPDALHNSPAKQCPAATGSCNLAVTKLAVQSKEVQITIKNAAATDAVLIALNLTWPAANGKLKQIKLDGDVIYDNPDLAPPAAALTTAQLAGDSKKRTIQKNGSDVLHLLFENNVDPVFAHYIGSTTFGSGCDLVILP